MPDDTYKNMMEAIRGTFDPKTGLTFWQLVGLNIDGEVQYSLSDRASRRIVCQGTKHEVLAYVSRETLP